MDGLRKILKICYRNGFFHLQSSGSTLKTVQYGPLGSLFKRNILREWISSFVNNTDVCLFPIEVVQTKNQSECQKLHKTQAYSFLQDVIKNYFRTFSAARKENPWGVAMYGINDCSNQDFDIFSSPLLSKLESRSQLSIIFFCPVKKSVDWFNYWTQYRYRWWRKFSSIPSKFSMSNVTETVSGDQQISLLMEFPWGKESLETITLHNENFFKTACESLSPEYMKNINLNSAIIMCHSELDLAAFAYLNNSYAEKWREKEIRKLFHLHAKLAPYKVCLSVNADNVDDLKNLKDVARHLEKELKKCRVAVFPCFEVSEMDNVSQFKRYDEMGVPYTVVLNKKALHSGIAALRNRDTTLEEQVHIAELTPKLLKYLQMKSYEVDEC